MIASKNNGFTLVEALISMAIIAIALTPIMLLQTTLLRIVDQGNTSIKRILQAQTFLVQAQRTARLAQENEQAPKTVENPRTVLKYQVRPLNPDSSLKNFKTIKAEHVIFQWNQAQHQRSDTLVSFFYKPEKT